MRPLSLVVVEKHGHRRSVRLRPHDDSENLLKKRNWETGLHQNLYCCLCRPGRALEALQYPHLYALCVRGVTTSPALRTVVVSQSQLRWWPINDEFMISPGVCRFILARATMASCFMIAGSAFATTFTPPLFMLRTRSSGGWSCCPVAIFPLFIAHSRGTSTEVSFSFADLRGPWKLLHLSRSSGSESHAVLVCSLSWFSFNWSSHSVGLDHDHVVQQSAQCLYCMNIYD